MILFPEEQKDYATQELENVKAEVMGTTTTSITEDQAKMLIKNQKKKELSDDDAHQLLIELSSKFIYQIFRILIELGCKSLREMSKSLFRHKSVIT